MKTFISTLFEPPNISPPQENDLLLFVSGSIIYPILSTSSKTWLLSPFCIYYFFLSPQAPSSPHANLLQSFLSSQERKESHPFPLWLYFLSFLNFLNLHRHLKALSLNLFSLRPPLIPFCQLFCAYYNTLFHFLKHTNDVTLIITQSSISTKLMCIRITWGFSGECDTYCSRPHTPRNLES